MNMILAKFTWEKLHNRRINMVELHSNNHYLSHKLIQSSKSHIAKMSQEPVPNLNIAQLIFQLKASEI